MTDVNGAALDRALSRLADAERKERDWKQFYEDERQGRWDAERERDQLWHENHHLHAKVLSRDSLLKQVSETQLAKDVTEAEARLAEAVEALETAQGEAYLGGLAGDDTPSPLAACENVIDVCMAALEHIRGDEPTRPHWTEAQAKRKQRGNYFERTHTHSDRDD